MGGRVGEQTGAAKFAKREFSNGLQADDWLIS